MHLKNAWEEGGSRRHRIVLVAEVVPLAPLVHEDPQIGRVLVQAEEQFVQIMSGTGRLHVNDDIDTGLNVEGILPLQVLLCLHV